MGNVSCCLLCKQLLSPWLASIVTTADLPNTLNNTKRGEKVCCLPLSELTLVWKLRVDGGNSFSFALFPFVHCCQVERRADLPDPFWAHCFSMRWGSLKIKNKQPVRIGFALCSEFNSLRLHSNWNKKKNI